MSTDARHAPSDEVGVNFAIDRPRRAEPVEEMIGEISPATEPTGPADAGQAPAGQDRRSALEPGQVAVEPAPARTSPRYDPEALRPEGPVGSTVPALEGWRGRLNALGFHLAPGVEELERRQGLAQIAQPFSRTMTVMVANPKGQAGKTPTTLCLAAALAVPRGDGIAAWDNNEARGNMHVRTHAHGATQTVRDMLDAIDFLESPAANASHVRSYLRRQVAGQYDVLVSQSQGGTLITAEEFTRVRTVLSRYYSVLVVDTGNAEAAVTWRATRDAADVLVVPTPWALDGCYSATQMLRQLEDDGFGDLVANAIIVATSGPSEYSDAARREYLPYFSERARAVVEIPVDGHIHAKGVIEHDGLAASSRQAYTRLAAEVVTLLREVDRTRQPQHV